MATLPETDTNDTLLLFDIPWSAYSGMVDALPNHSWRHTYAEGTLEIFVNAIHFVSWTEYEQILQAFGERRFRHTYRDGTLEMMSPSEEHEWIKAVLGRLVETASLECDVAIKSFGSATQRHKKLAQGLEPDESYYLGKSPVRSRKRSSTSALLPNLVIEVDIRRPDVDRLEAYALLGIREVWRYQKGKVEFLSLASGRQYVPVSHSVALPLVSSKEVSRIIKRLDDTDENDLIKEFVTNLRTLRREAE